MQNPFNGPGPFEWNQVPTGLEPPRERCQSVASEDERQAAVKLIQEYGPGKYRRRQ